MIGRDAFGHKDIQGNAGVDTIFGDNGRIDYTPVRAPDDIPALGETAASLEAESQEAGTRVLTDAEVRRLERDNLSAALEQAGGKVSGDKGAAALLGLKPSTFASRMKAMGLERPRKS